MEVVKREGLGGRERWRKESERAVRERESSSRDKRGR